MSRLDTDISNYTVNDLISILNMGEFNKENIENSTNRIINKMQNEGKTDVAIFFEDAKNFLIKELDNNAQYITDNNAYNNTNNNLDIRIDNLIEKQTGLENLDLIINDQDNPNTNIGNWWQNQYPAQNNIAQMQKVTDRNHRVQIFDDNHLTMNREKLGVNESYTVPIAQGTINPNLKNVTSRLVVIDSQYRNNILPAALNDTNAPAFNSNFTFDLAYPLTNVLSLKLYSVQIPTTWYTFDQTLGNTMFTIDSSCVTLPDGNYTIDALMTKLNALTTAVLTFSCDPNTNIVSINNPTVSPVTIVYYSKTGLSNDASGCLASCGKGSTINQNLFWNLGFRNQLDIVEKKTISITIGAHGTTSGVAPIDVYGPKYFILKLDDFNKNRRDNSISGIIQTESKLNLPSYYTPDTVKCVNNNNQIIQSAPRKLTQSQLYSINEIMSNRNEMVTRSSPPSTNNSLAVLSLNNITTLRPNPYVDNNPSLLVNKRDYFGPVDISRMKAQLIDDKGNLVNLHDNDWSFTIIVEELYEY